jgi:hypothetical protein
MNDSSESAAPEFATFWHGPLNATTFACLASFPRVRARLRFYTYAEAVDLPPGVEAADARAICPDASLVRRFIALGKPSVASFADYFRYHLIRKTGCCWVDSDMICLKKPAFASEPIVFGRQSEAFGRALINNAVLKLPPGDPLLADLIDHADKAVDVDQSWGAIGPFLLSDLAEKHRVDQFAHPFADFYPIEPDHFWKPLLPACYDDVARATSDATFLHLWSELFVRSRYDQSAGPPPGSFLHDLFARYDALRCFERFHDAGELENLFAGRRAKETIA